MNVQTYSVKEVAAIFKVKPKTVRNWIAQGKIAASRIGRAYLIPAQEVRKVTGPAVQSASVIHNTGMAEIKALLRSAKGKMDIESYRADFMSEVEFYRKSDSESWSNSANKRYDPGRKNRVAALQGSLMDTNLTVASLDDCRKKELGRLRRQEGDL